jgi:hypothetical protein
MGSTAKLERKRPARVMVIKVGSEKIMKAKIPPMSEEVE